MIRTDFPRTVTVLEQIVIPLRDGTKLAARIWLPVDADTRPVPAILEYLPYRKRDGTHERDALTYPYLAGNGYAGVRVDIRGSGESEGLLEDEYTKQEHDDALEVIAWIASQPWCTGRVGMMGISWGGFNALQVAARRPPALNAIVTLCSTDDRYADDVHYMGGTLLRGGLDWGSFLLRAMCHPPDPALVGDWWRASWHARLSRVPLFLKKWLQHQRRDGYWKQGSVCEDYSAIKCAVYAVGGWTDGYTNAIPRLLEHLSTPRKGLIGPWAHAYPHSALPGPQIGFLQELLRWWDYWLKGVENDIMGEPMLRVWLTDSVKPAVDHAARPGRWVEETEWPPRHVVREWLYLKDQGLDATTDVMRPRTLSTGQTVGAQAGEWCPFGSGGDQAGDQQDDDARSLVFDSSTLPSSIELLGAPTLTIVFESDKPVANLIVRLCDVLPTGESLRLSFGALNLTHRDGHEFPAPLEPGRRYQVQIQLNDLGAIVPAGHKIRLALSTTYWSMIWPAPEAATLTIFSGTLELPRRTRTDSIVAKPFEEVETASPEVTTQIRPGVERIDRIGLEIGTEGRSRYSVDDDDPLSAVADIRRADTVARGHWKVRIETHIHVACTVEHFQLQAQLRAWEDEMEVCSREWKEDIPRDLM